MATIVVKRRLKSGKTITYQIKDKGKQGKTPERERWFAPSISTGWSKLLPQAKRIKLTVQAHKGDLLASARSLRALANVSTDRETKKKASADAAMLFARYKKQKRVISVD